MINLINFYMIVKNISLCFVMILVALISIYFLIGLCIFIINDIKEAFFDDSK